MRHTVKARFHTTSTVVNGPRHAVDGDGRKAGTTDKMGDVSQNTHTIHK